MVKNTIFLVNLGTKTMNHSVSNLKYLKNILNLVYDFKIEETVFSTAESKFDSMFF